MSSSGQAAAAEPRTPVSAAGSTGIPRPVYVISVAARIVAVDPRTLRIYEDEGLIEPARTPTTFASIPTTTCAGSCGSGTSPRTAA